MIQFHVFMPRTKCDQKTWSCTTVMERGTAISSVYDCGKLPKVLMREGSTEGVGFGVSATHAGVSGMETLNLQPPEPVAPTIPAR